MEFHLPTIASSLFSAPSQVCLLASRSCEVSKFSTRTIPSEPAAVALNESVARVSLFGKWSKCTTHRSLSCGTTSLADHRGESVLPGL